MEKLNVFDDEQNRKDYIFMNKNVEVAKFHVDTKFKEIIIDDVLLELPFWITDLDVMISNRRAPKHRENIEFLLKQSGCDTLTGFLDVSHALSLIDTFWVKSANSALQWEDVSLYTHSFDEAIAKTAFEGGLHGRQFTSTSPEYGTDGSFAKCWIRENDQIKLLKRGSSGARNAGLEPYSEFYASQLISKFTNNYVTYNLRSRNGKICSICDIFTDEKYGFVPYAAFDSKNSNYTKVLDKITELLGDNTSAKTMFIVDAVILNEDRHKNNFGFIVDNDTQEIIDFAPLFDHNIALLPYAEEEDFKNIEEYLSMKGPRLSEDWVTAAARCMTPEARRVLINLRDFKFEKHSKYNLPDWRLRALEKVIHSNIDAILKLC